MATVAARPGVKVERAHRSPTRAPRADQDSGLDPQAIRRIILEQSMRAGVGHIGSALSVVEAVAAIYGVLRGRPGDPDRDRFILSKGHAALAVYAALHLSGVLGAAELDTYCGDDTLLGVHPERDLPGIDFSTGSLGHGLPLAVGAALAARLQRSERRAYALLSDAECDEGSVWEAAMLAAHHRLSNLVAVIDMNGQQALGATDEVVSLRPLSSRWQAFGWEAIEVDGHDLEALTRSLIRPPADPRPKVVIARTVFGRGVSFMEGQLRWHYLPMSELQYRAALAGLGETP